MFSVVMQRTTLLRHVHYLKKCRRNSSNVQYKMRRTLLYIPGDDTRKIKKSFNIDADAIALDCEDGVSLNRKREARQTIFEFLNREKPKKPRDYDWGVRINSVQSGLCQEDLETVLSAKNLPDTISLPKVDDVENIKWFSNRLDKLIKKDAHISLIMFIESAKALMNIKNICEQAIEIGKHGKFQPVALVFGADDFIADIGARKTDHCNEILYARQKFVLTAKAFRLQAIDMVYIQYKDLDGLRRQSVEGANMGFTGKQVIHPDQVPVVQDAFLPDKKQIQWAESLIKAYYEHQASGKGAFNFGGTMVDSPTLKQAENLVQLVKMVGKK